MRIISGKYKGRVLKGFEINGTRPTMDRVKESVFAMIQNQIKDSICLDLFAGSGNLGIEALSNGAKECTFVDSNKIAGTTIQKNCELCKIEESYHVYVMDFKNALKLFSKEGKKFDLIFLDPPYHENLITPTLKLIDQYQLLKENGLVICEFEKEQIKSPFSLIKEKTYGSKTIYIYQK